MTEDSAQPSVDSVADSSVSHDEDSLSASAADEPDSVTAVFPETSPAPFSPKRANVCSDDLPTTNSQSGSEALDTCNEETARPSPSRPMNRDRPQVVDYRKSVAIANLLSVPEELLDQESPLPGVATTPLAPRGYARVGVSSLVVPVRLADEEAVAPPGATLELSWVTELSPLPYHPIAR